jgi:hypothetical protein
MCAWVSEVPRTLEPSGREPGTVRWLILSVALSVVLTVLLNLGLRVFPEAGNRVARSLAELTAPNTDNGRGNDRRVRVFAPWKAMILGSVVLTIVVNLVLWIT